MKKFAVPALFALWGLAAVLVAAACTPSSNAAIAINELMPSPAASDAEFLELHNITSNPVDVGGWCFVEGIDGCLPAGTTIAANGFLLMVQDEAVARAEWGIDPSTPLFEYSGGQKSSGETIVLHDADANVADEVTYGAAAPWPSAPMSGLASLERINPAFGSSDGANWGPSNPSPTPLAENSVFDGTTAPPLTIAAVATSPNRPDPQQDVLVAVQVSTGAAVTLTYVVNFDLPVSIPMTSSNGAAYTASIPGGDPGDLIRYRVDADDGTMQAGSPTAAGVNYHGVVVTDPSVVSAVPVLEWFMEDAIYDDLLANHRFDNVTGPAVLAYDGVVYDGVTMRVRGGSARLEPKVNWKVDMPPGQLFDMPGLLHEPVDEFAIQRDQLPVAGLGWDAISLAGQPEVDYIFVRQQRNGQFHGTGAYLELNDGRWRDRNGLDAGSYYRVDPPGYYFMTPFPSEQATRESGFFDKREGDPNDFSDLHELLLLLGEPEGPAQLDALFDSFDVPAVVNYLAILATIAHTDSQVHNFSLARADDTGRWELLHWDLDNTFGQNITGNGVPQFPVGFWGANQLHHNIYRSPELSDLILRRIRSLHDAGVGGPASRSQFEGLLNSLAPEYALEEQRWGGIGDLSNFVTNASTKIQETRQSVADNLDPNGLVPGPQPTAPGIVFNEVYSDPPEGSDAEYVELYNPHDTPVDISGWTIGAGVEVTLRGGTVIPAQGELVVVKDDLTFRSVHGSGHYVAGVYDGKLANDGELIELRDDGGQLVDALSFTNSAPWPDTNGGSSLARLDPSGDTNAPATWTAAANGGSPGTTNSTP